MNLIFGMSADGSALLLQRKATGQSRFTLFDDKLVDLSFLLVFCLSTLTLFVVLGQEFGLVWR
jgi:hypothetical protein